MTPRARRELLATALDERQRRNAERSLHSFLVNFVWPAVQPGVEFRDNWHIGAICDHLEAVHRRQIKRLVINVPFRTAKSTITSVAWPAWTWIHQPNHQWLCGSYAEKLAIRDALRHRRLVTSAEYERHWGDKVQLAGDQSQKVRFQNTANGHRIAFGMTGGVMGDGGDTLLIDDPHDRQGAHSDAEREHALTTFDEALLSRLNDPATGAIVIIMQRLHTKDLSGHVLAQKGWEHLCLPMEHEGSSKVTSIGFKDPRTKVGEVLDIQRFPPAALSALKEGLGSYGTAGQLQQRPAPEGGGILKPACFKLWPATSELPRFAYVVQSYDTAYTDQTTNDPTAMTAYGVFEHAGKRQVMLLEAWSEHMSYPDLKPKLIADWAARYGTPKSKDPLNKPRKPDVMLIEEKGSGIALIRDLRASKVPCLAYNPGGASKVARAHISAPLLEAGTFWVPESRKEPGKPILWARAFLEQLEQFPAGEHDDYVDTFTQAAIHLRDGDWLDVIEAAPDEIEEHDYRADKLDNAYSA